MVIVPVLWTSGVDGSVSSLSPGRLEKFERSLQSCFSICGAAQSVDRGFADSLRLGAMVHGSGARGRVRLEESLKLMIIGLHVG